MDFKLFFSCRYLVLVLFCFISFGLNGQTPLLDACKQNDFSKNLALIKNESNINQADENGATALMWACYHNQFKTVKALIVAGANPKLRGVIYTSPKKTAYYGSLTGIAAGKGYLPLLKYLIDELKLPVDGKGYNPKNKKIDGRTAIQWAGAEGKKDCYDFLLAKGADELQQDDSTGKSASAYWGELKWDLLHQQQLKLLNEEKYQKALFVAEKQLFIAKKNKLLSKVVASKYFLGIIHARLHNYKEAKEVLEELIFLFERVAGEDHKISALVHSQLGSIYSKLGDYTNATKLLTKTMNTNIKNFGPTHHTTSKSYSKLGLLHHELKDYVRAKELLTKAMISDKKNYGTYHPTMTVRYYNLGSLYQDLGDYSRAKELLAKAVFSAETNLGANHLMTIKIYTGLGLAYLSLGDYFNSKEYLTKAQVTAEKELGVNHYKTAVCYTNLAGYFDAIGDYYQAKELLVKSLLSDENNFGSDHIKTVGNYANIATIYVKLGDYEHAKELLTKAMLSEEKNFGPDHPTTAVSYSNLGIVYRTLGDYSRAKELLTKAVLSAEKNFGSEHPTTAGRYSNLATVYKALGDYSRAKELLTKAMLTNEKKFGNEHPTTALIYSNLATVFQAYNKKGKALSLLSKSIASKKERIINSMLFLSEKERRKYISSIQSDFIAYNSFVYDNDKATPEHYANIYANELLLKGLLLQYRQTLRIEINQSDDSELKSVYEKYVSSSRLVTREQLKPISKRSLNTDSLQQLINKYEVQLGNKSQAFRKSKEVLSLGWKDIQRKLKQDEAAIEYISFKKWNKKWTDTIQYCALVLRKNDKAPKLVKLCTVFELKKLLQVKSKNELYRNSIIHVDAELGHGSKLNRLVWEPIDSLLTGVKKLYVSPSGLLNKISFAAIPLNDSTLLSDKYHFQQVSSTRLVCDQKELKLNKNMPLRMAMFGGITYDTKQVKQAEDIRVAVNRSDSLVYLPGTKEEIEAIAGSLSQQLKQVVINKYSEQAATEKQFRALGNGTKKSPDFIHTATHGFYISGQEAKQHRELSLEGNNYKMHEDPMYRSGLMFANANYAWSGKFFPNSQNDGICTASEVSNLNLSNTKLVVLSACQTGLGDIDGYEGVYGLQRAFKMAGVDFLLVSLWKVPDGATAELMTIFYEIWANDGVDIRVAFRQAQQQMRELYPDSPEKWAGFVLVE